MRRITLALALATAALLPRLATAQSVNGVVVDPADRPVAGVVILLLDPTAHEAARSLSNELGEYRLTAPGAGEYRIRTLRIGFRPLTSEAIVLRAGETVTRRLTLSSVAVSLDTVRALGRNTCRMSVKDSSMVVWTAWEQVRAALTAAQLTATNRTMTATTVSYQRTLDPGMKRIRAQTADVRSDLVRQPWLALSPELLHRAGYVTTDAANIVTYNAPGLEALVSSIFLDDHCVRLTTDRDPTRLGIAFEPTPDRKDVSDIRGTLWLDRKTTELRSLEFRYANVSKDQEDYAGGDMEFARMRNGSWAISRWSIRMPVFELQTGGAAMRAQVPHLVEVQVIGGELSVVTIASAGVRDTIWSRPPLTLNGVVSDSSSGAPVRGARIGLVGTSLDGVTDASGRFAIPGVLPGRYTLQIRTASLDSINTITQSDVMFTDSVTSIKVRVPSALQIASTLCGNGRAIDRLSTVGIVVGTVDLRGDSTPPRNVRVVAEWVETTMRGTDIQRQPHVDEARTDARGMYRMCGVPVNTAVTVRATIDSASAAPVQLRIPAGERFGRVDLTLDRAIVAGAVLAGTVTADSSKRPIVDAEISIPDLGISVRTDDQGAFRLSDIPPGSHQVVVRRLGYGALDTRIDFVANKTVDRRIVLTRIVTLDSVLTTSNRAPDVPMVEFEERRKLGFGHFVTRADLDKLGVAHLNAAVVQMPGASVVASHGSHAYVLSKRAPISACQPQDVQCMQRERLYYVPTELDRSQGVVFGCYARVYMDKTLMNPGHPTDPFDLGTIQSNQVEAMEWYASASQVPTLYGAADARCGVLIIHTRRPTPK